ncbi:hypothetical protein EON82_21245 [bacterium]|nr:MAG: hypothetical protein EON82_21245 [bacterium]
MTHGSAVWARAVLGVTDGAGRAECQRAYRQLILANHPDRLSAATHSELRLAEERVKDLNLAWEILREQFRDGQQARRRGAFSDEGSQGHRVGAVWVPPPPGSEWSANPRLELWESTWVRFGVAAALIGTVGIGGNFLWRGYVERLEARETMQTSMNADLFARRFYRPLTEAERAKQIRLTVQRNLAAFPSEAQEALLMAATAGRNLEVREYVLAGVDPNRPGKGGAYVLSILASRPKNRSTVEFLLARKPSRQALSAAMFAAVNDPPMLELLARHGASAKVRDARGNTLLHKVGRPDAAEKLVALGADINAKNRAGKTPVDVAEGARQHAIEEKLRVLGGRASQGSLGIASFVERRATGFW